MQHNCKVAIGDVQFDKQRSLASSASHTRALQEILARKSFSLCSSSASAAAGLQSARIRVANWVSFAPCLKARAKAVHIEPERCTFRSCGFNLFHRE